MSQSDRAVRVCDYHGNASNITSLGWKALVSLVVVTTRTVAVIVTTLPPLTPLGNFINNRSSIPQTDIRIYKIGFLPALTENKGRSKHFVGAFKSGLNDVNARLLSTGANFQLDYLLNDSKSDTVESIRGMTFQYKNGVVVFIGPENTCAVEARVAAAWNLPMIAFRCRESAVPDLTLVRTIPSTSKVSKSVISLLKQFHWDQFTAVVGNSSNWLDVAETLETLAEQNEIKIHKVVFFPEPYVVPEGMPGIIEDTYRSTRIYVFLGDHHALIDFVRDMQKRGLDNGDYLVIAVRDAPFDPSERFFNKYVEPTVEANMVEAFRIVLMVTPRAPSDTNYTRFIDETRTYSYEAPFNAPTPPMGLLDMKVPVPIFAAYLYDAVNVYARALQEAIAEGIDPFDGTEIVKKIKGRIYDSIQGHEMYIDDSGDAEANYTVLALTTDPSADPDDVEGRRILSPIGYFYTRGHDGPEYHSDRQIEWINGSPPASEPPCGFDNRKCNSQSKWPIVVGCVVAVCLAIAVAVFAYRHYKYEQKLSSLFWKIDYKDIVVAEFDSVDNTVTDKFKYRILGRLSHFSSGDSTCHDSKGCGQLVHSKVASYRGCLVAVKMFRHRNHHIEVTRAIQKELYLLKELTHDNVNRFIGVCFDPPNISIVSAFCSRGSLKDILQNKDLHLDGILIASLVFDLIKGMIFLHESEFISHGHLKPSNCLVDSRWVLQVSDFGLHDLKYSSMESPPAVSAPEDGSNHYYSRFLWRAPELLRDPCSLPRGSQKGDIYSFGLIMYEIHSRNCPYWVNSGLTPKDLYNMLSVGSFDNDDDVGPWRPDISMLKCEGFVRQCIEECLQEDADLRPDFKYTRVRLKSMQKGLRSNIFDNMLAIMEKYANTLESLVDERTMQLAEEKKKTEALLLRMLPRSVTEQLIRGERVVPELYDKVTIYFSDIVGFTSLSAESSPMQVVNVLNDLYTMFDSIIGSYDVYKVETIGDAYMVVSGLPIRNGDIHAGEIASLSLHLLRDIRDFRIRHRPTETLKLRIGIHTGPVVAGVVGLTMPRYCLFGDTVNTASRMESTGLALRIHCSEECKQMLDKLGGYILEPRGTITIKGKGDLFTYFLTGEDCASRQQRLSSKQKPLSDHCVEDHGTLRSQDSSANSKSQNADSSVSANDLLTNQKTNDKSPANRKTFEKSTSNQTSSERAHNIANNERGIMEFIFPKSARSTVMTSCSSTDCCRRHSKGTSDCSERASSSLQDCSVMQEIRGETALTGHVVKDFRIPKFNHGARVSAIVTGCDGGDSISSIVSSVEWCSMSKNDDLGQFVDQRCQQGQTDRKESKRQAETRVTEYSLSESVV